MPHEERREVRSFQVKFICDCGEEMQSTGRMRSTSPPTVEYLCPVCNTKALSPSGYPRTEYEEI
jgi:predicted SprT family Zn-dependent metalloprotease